MSSSNSRDKAEAAFGDLQSQFFSRGNASDEIDHVTKTRDEKTSRLREARLAKEAEDRLAAKAKPAPKPRKRV
jgi:hypothetical protein